MRSRTRPGAMLLITVLITGAVAMAISLNIALNGIAELDMGFGGNQSLETLAIADGCVQEALLRLSRSSAYTGATLTVGDGSCDITVTTVGSNRVITSAATLEKWTRTIEVLVDLSTSTPTLLEWTQI